MRQQVGDARHGRVQRFLARRQGIGLAPGFQRKIQQALGVIVGRPQDLAARHVLERGRNAALQAHAARVQRLRVTKARQRGAIGAQQEHRLDRVAGGLASASAASCGS